MKRHMSKHNQRWKYNKHKKPFFFTSELNKLIHDRGDMSVVIVHTLWNENFKAFYKFKKRRRWL